MGNKDLENLSKAETLEWIKTFEEIESMDKGKGFREKMVAKVKENPLVPIGEYEILFQNT